MKRINFGITIVAAATAFVLVAASADAASPRGRGAALDGLVNASVKSGGGGGDDRLTEQISLLANPGGDVPGVKPRAGEPTP